MEYFFVGLHQVHHAHHFDFSFISANRLRRRRGGKVCFRKKPFAVNRWIMDSGAFSELSREQDKDAAGDLLPNDYRLSVFEHFSLIEQWASNGQFLAAVAQDYMCEKFILDKTGLTIEEHQRRTIVRYDTLMMFDPSVYILPVLQGYDPADYVRHLRMYGKRLAFGTWVGVGSICKRNATPESVLAVLRAIKEERPDLRLHGFGLKITALADPRIRELLFSADSMAWSFQARKQGRDANSWQEAKAFVDRIESFRIAA
jgi:hypothetical protein